MASDNEYDNFDYHSSQDSFYFDDQIDRFESRQSFKLKKTKQKLRKSSYHVSMQGLKSNVSLIKVHCVNNDQLIPIAKQKPFRNQHHRQKPNSFQCDQQLRPTVNKSPDPSISKSNHLSKKLEENHTKDFSEFRRHFYYVMRKSMKSSFQDQSNIKITNIRLASVHENVQKEFMEKLRNNSQHFPQLVYHGTHLLNIESILRYGFLIPGQTHPGAPTIVSRHGQAYGIGIYSCLNACYPLSYVHCTNTLLACAALPQRNKAGLMAHRHGDILVLRNESQIIPLFLIDFTYSTVGQTNFSPFYTPKEITEDNNQQVRKPVSLSRKYLRKILSYINDDTRKNNRYQIRSFEF